MKSILSSFLVVATLTLAAAPAPAADSPLVGTWRIDRAKSSFTGDTFTNKPLPGGKFEYMYGTSSHYTFACDGTLFATDIAEYTGTCKKTGPSTYSFKSFNKGKLTDIDDVTISADGKTYADAGTRYRPDGKTAHDTSTYARVGSGTGIGGTWKTAKVSSASPYTLSFTSTAAGPQMANPDYKWKLVLKTDGSKSPVAGPTIPAGMYAVATADGPSNVHFKIKLGDKTYSENTLKVSNDGKTLSWTSQAPGNSATTAVYDKE